MWTWYDLFVDLVRRLSITRVDAYVNDVLKDERLGVEAIQIRPGGRGVNVLTSETLRFVPAELVYVFINQYIKPVVSSPELQYLFPLVPGDGVASFGTLAMLLEESSKRVHNWHPLEISNMDHMIEMTGPLASFRPNDKEVIRKAPEGSSEYRRLKVMHVVLGHLHLAFLYLRVSVYDYICVHSCTNFRLLKASIK